MERVSVYIDGFNLYRGLKDESWQRFYWIDLSLFARNLFCSYYEQVHSYRIQVHYFTTRIRSNPLDPNSKSRQNRFIEALDTLPNLTIHYGSFAEKDAYCSKCAGKNQRCSVCNKPLKLWVEKKTDVNIATQLLCDAFENIFDIAILVSGDSDLVEPIKTVRNRHHQKQMLVAFPPNRHSNELREHATNVLKIEENLLKTSQMPDIVLSPDGYPLKRPAAWR